MTETMAPTSNDESYMKNLEKLYQSIQQKTSKEVLHINLLNKKATIFESKFGGIPYVPKDKKIPVDVNGKQQVLLAQINCEDTASPCDYMDIGLFQFFITPDD